jgi:hypothetical protein
MHFILFCHCLISETPARKGNSAQFLCLIFIYLQTVKYIFILNFMQQEVKGVRWSGALAAWVKAVSLGPSILVVLQAAFLQIVKVKQR